MPDFERTERAAQAALAQYETDQAREAAQITALEERLNRLQMEHDDVKGQLERAQASLKDFDNLEDLSEQIKTIREELLKAREIADDASATYRGLKRELEAREERRKRVETDRADWTKRGAAATERVTSLQKRLELSLIHI